MIQILSVIVGVLWLAPDVSSSQDHPRVLIVYYSGAGHTRTMAGAVADGARSVDAVLVVVRSVEEATTEDVLQADAIIVGSPVYNANVAPEVQSFINGWPFEGTPMTDKIGAAFCTAGGISAGEELVQLGILHSMLIFGMIVVGGPEWSQAFGASAVTQEHPFGETEWTGGNSAFLKKGFALGRRVAELTKRMQRDSY